MIGAPFEIDERDAMSSQDRTNGRTNTVEVDDGLVGLFGGRLLHAKNGKLDGVAELCGPDLPHVHHATRCPREKKEPIPKTGIRLRGSA
jgi:hypothetical protein